VTGGRKELDALRGRLLDAAELEAGDDVLDLGDGSGLLTADLRVRIGDGGVYAVSRDVETLEELLRAAHELDIAGVAYLVGDADVLPLPDASVDAAVGHSPLSDADEMADAAGELHRVLRAAGRLAIVERGDAGELTTALQAAGFSEIAVAAVADSDSHAESPVLITARKP
jgi:ubiquinone/menaquinone biosynthesis C-methylase UbiE